MLAKKAIFTLLMVFVLTAGLYADGTIVYAIRPDWVDENTGESADMPTIYALEDAGYEVIIFNNVGLDTVDQATLDTLYNANLIIIGRSCPSVDFMDAKKPIWNSIPTPMICLEMWALRNTRMNWFNTADITSNSEEEIVFNAIIEEPDDPVFEGIDLSDPIPWWISPYDNIGTADEGNGICMARFESDNNVAFVRFEEGVEFYVGAGDYPEGPRTMIGSGRDNGSNPPFDYYNWTEESEKVFFAEVARMYELGGGTPNAVKKEAAQPTNYSLAQNYPNPFNPSTNIEFTLSKAGHTTLQVFNIQGKLVATLVDNNLSAGLHTVHFAADDLSAGIYYYSIKHDNFTDVKKMILIK